MASCWTGLQWTEEGFLVVRLLSKALASLGTRGNSDATVCNQLPFSYLSCTRENNSVVPALGHNNVPVLEICSGQEQCHTSDLPPPKMSWSQCFCPTRLLGSSVAVQEENAHNLRTATVVPIAASLAPGRISDSQHNAHTHIREQAGINASVLKCNSKVTNFLKYRVIWTPLTQTSEVFLKKEIYLPPHAGLL